MNTNTHHSIDKSGKLHVSLLRLVGNWIIKIMQMATELQDTALLARISGGDLIVIEAKCHYNCVYTYRSAQRVLFFAAVRKI